MEHPDPEEDEGNGDQNEGQWVSHDAEEETDAQQAQLVRLLTCSTQEIGQQDEDRHIAREAEDRVRYDPVVGRYERVVEEDRLVAPESQHPQDGESIGEERMFREAAHQEVQSEGGQDEQEGVEGPCYVDGVDPGRSCEDRVEDADRRVPEGGVGGRRREEGEDLDGLRPVTGAEESVGRTREDGGVVRNKESMALDDQHRDDHCGRKAHDDP